MNQGRLLRQGDNLPPPVPSMAEAAWPGPALASPFWGLASALTALLATGRSLLKNKPASLLPYCNLAIALCRWLHTSKPISLTPQVPWGFSSIVFLGSIFLPPSPSYPGSRFPAILEGP